MTSEEIDLATEDSPIAPKSREATIHERVSEPTFMMSADHMSITVSSDDIADMGRFWLYLSQFHHYQAVERSGPGAIVVKAKPRDLVGIRNKNTGEKKYGNAQPGELLAIGDWEWFDETVTEQLTDRDPRSGREDIFNDLAHWRQMYRAMSAYDCENCGLPLGDGDRTSCGICRRRHHGHEYCGEGYDTAPDLGVPVGYRIGSDEELDALMEGPRDNSQLWAPS